MGGWPDGLKLNKWIDGCWKLMDGGMGVWMNG